MRHLWPALDVASFKVEGEGGADLRCKMLAMMLWPILHRAAIEAKPGSSST